MKKKRTVSRRRKAERGLLDLLQDKALVSWKIMKRSVWDSLALIGLTYLIIQFSKWLTGGG